MSSGASCTLFTDGTRHGYKMQCWPYGETTEYDYHGPFTSEDAAIDHTDSNYQNPGGWGVANVSPEDFDKILARGAR